MIFCGFWRNITSWELILVVFCGANKRGNLEYNGEIISQISRIRVFIYGLNTI